MISHEKKFYFVHISKTGGNSIQSALEQYSSDKIEYFDNRFGKNQDIRIFNEKMGDNRNVKHTSAEWFLVNFPECKEYFKFTCIRNPWDRTVSRYFWKFDTFDKERFKQVINWHEYRAQKFDYEGCDFIMRFENLQEDFNTVCDKIGIEHIELPVMNKSNRGDYHQYYDDETREMVYNKFKEDIDDFGYTFE